MSYVPQPYNPYDDPAYQPVTAGRPIEPVKRLQYLYAYQFLFESGNWFVNLLMGCLAWLSSQVVPIIGPLVFLGYQYEVIDHLHRQRTVPYPDFDFNRFGDYLSRGAPPFVVSLIFGFLIVPLVFVFYFVGVIAVPITLAMTDQSNAPEGLMAGVAILFVSLLFLLFLLFIVLLSMVTGPMSLRAGLSGNIGEGFNIAFVVDFLKRMWFDMLLVYLWLTVIGILMYTVGLMMFCIGAYPAMTWSQMASTHLHWQLYEIYLTRGGMVIPLKQP